MGPKDALVALTLASGICLAGCDRSVRPLNETPSTPTLYVLTAANPGPAQIAEFASGSASATPLATLSTTGWNEGIDGSGNLFLLNSSDVQVYAPGASGSAAPIRTITLEGSPETSAFAVDQSGNAYLSNGLGDIVVYPASASGSSQPSRTIGPPSGLGWVQGLAVDGSGYLYVATYTLGVGPNPILVFAPNADGNATPVRTINIYPISFTVGADGTLYTTDNAGQGKPSNNEIVIYPPGASGNPVPSSTIIGSSTNLASSTLWFIAADSQGTIYVYDQTNQSGFAVLQFAAGSSGNAAPSTVLTVPNMVSSDLAVH